MKSECDAHHHKKKTSKMVKTKRNNVQNFISYNIVTSYQKHGPRTNQVTDAVSRQRFYTINLLASPGSKDILSRVRIDDTY